MSKPKIILYDLETFPNIGYSWGKYEQNMLGFTKEWELASFAYKELGSSKVHCIARPNFKDKTDKSLTKALHKVLGSADITIAHNGLSFDNKKSNAKFIEHGLTPLSYHSIDTRNVARKYFKFNSNSLNDLGQLLKLGKKVSTGGFELWEGCMAGDAKAWAKMIKYNKQDVLLLEKVYEKLKPWITNHPNTTGRDANWACHNCGSKEYTKRGYGLTTKFRYERRQCTNCGSWKKGPNERLKA